MSVPARRGSWPRLGGDRRVRPGAGLHLAADIFGTHFVGAIHGRLLTAWSAAGILGPVLAHFIREYQIEQGIPAAQAYNVTMYVLAGLLVADRYYSPTRSSSASGLPSGARRVGPDRRKEIA